MKEKGYILAKIFKKHVVALMLFTVLLVLFLVNVFNKQDVYAAEMVANVKCDVFLVNGENRTIISSKVQNISNLDDSIINFSDVDVELDRFSKLEFDYEVENINRSSGTFIFGLKENVIENFVIEYYLNDNFCGDLTETYINLESFEVAKIKVVVYVENMARDAVLNGSLGLTFESVGGNNE